MASSSTNPTAGTNFGRNITEKLTKSNHVLSKAQVMSARGSQMEPFLDTEQALPAKEIEVTRGDKTEKEANPAYGMCWQETSNFCVFF
jgi:hypothetical protein